MLSWYYYKVVLFTVHISQQLRNLRKKEVKTLTRIVAIKAVVEKVIGNGKHGPFVVATSDAIRGSVTFSLEPTVWQEDEWPEEGAVVYLTNLREKRAGWRAKQGRHWLLSDEQTAKKENAMKSLKVFVEGLRQRFFPTEEDKTWKQWVDYKERETRDLIGLLSCDVKDSFKRRALFLLVVPSADFNPIYWAKEIGKYFPRTDFLKSLTADQLDYLADLIIGFCSVLRPMHCATPKHSVAGGSGIMIYTSIPDRYHDALHFYNNCIPHLLTQLPVEKAEKVFAHFSLINISTYSNLDNASGYNPFRNLFYIEGIDERWKREADARMREIVLSEISGESKPRKEWEEAIRQYADIVQMMLCGEIRCSLELYASQIQFIIDNRPGHNKLIDNWQVIKLFRLLAGDQYKELRHTIARYALLEDTGEFSKFSLYSGDTQEAANQILSEFGDDQELVAKIRELEVERDKKQAQNDAYQAEKKATENDILAQMR